MRVEQIMTTPATTILASAPVPAARAAMRQARIHHLVVLDRNRQIAGVLCSHDLRGADPGTTVEDLMSTPAVTLPASADVREAAKLLRRRNVGCLPLLECTRLVGVVTTSDLLELLGRGALHVQPSTTRWVLPKRGPTHRPEPRRP